MEKIIDWVSSKTLWLVFVPACIVVMATAAVPIYLFFQEGGWILSYEVNGSIGDFFGGIMNPIVALLALVWLVKGVNLQQKELKGTKAALEASERHQKAQVQIAAISSILQFDLRVIDDLEKNREKQSERIDRIREKIEKHSDNARLVQRLEDSLSSSQNDLYMTVRDLGKKRRDCSKHYIALTELRDLPNMEE